MELCIQPHQVTQRIRLNCDHNLGAYSRKQGFLCNRRHRPKHKDAKYHATNPVDGSRVPFDEDLIEHRFHHVGEQAHHGPLNHHEDARDDQQRREL